jgi:hypothetical protein
MVKRVTLDGVDVTHGCRMADTDAGEVEMYTTMPPTLKDGELLVETRRGVVVVELWLHGERPGEYASQWRLPDDH